jgi:hypothetical protein
MPGFSLSICQGKEGAQVGCSRRTVYRGLEYVKKTLQGMRNGEAEPV